MPKYRFATDKKVREITKKIVFSVSHLDHFELKTEISASWRFEPIARKVKLKSRRFYQTLFVLT
jgi:hypothetical protein